MRTQKSKARVLKSGGRYSASSRVSFTHTPGTAPTSVLLRFPRPQTRNSDGGRWGGLSQTDMQVLREHEHLVC